MLAATTFARILFRHNNVSMKCINNVSNIWQYVDNFSNCDEVISNKFAYLTDIKNMKSLE